MEREVELFGAGESEKSVVLRAGVRVREAVCLDAYWGRSSMIAEVMVRETRGRVRVSFLSMMGDLRECLAISPTT